VRVAGGLALRFLKILFWLTVAVLVTLFAAQNWQDVTIDLWGDLQADIKIPVLILIAFLLGFLPTLAIYRSKLWRVQNRVTMPRRDLPGPDDIAPTEPTQ
jgi:lipopolysaccharide assembly protein A